MRRATDAFAVLIAVAGFAVSYTTQVALAGTHGFGGWQAWLWPGIADAAALAMVLRLHLGQVRPGWYTVEAWIVFGVASTIMVGANAIADRFDPLGGAMHAVVPVVGMLVWHVVIHGRPAEDSARDIGEDAAAATTVDANAPSVQPIPAALTSIGPDTKPDSDQDASAPSPRPRRGAAVTTSASTSTNGRSAARAQVRRMVQRRGQDVTPADVAARTGLSRRHAARLLAEVRRPHLVEQEAR